MFVLDLAGAAVKLYQVIREDRELQAWIKLVLGTAYSGFIAFTGVCGASLSSGKPVALAFGFGLLACSVSVTGVLLRDPRARSLLLSIPQSVVTEYQKTGGQTTIEPADESKKQP